MGAVLDALFPRSCAGCDADGAEWCPVCAEGIALHRVETPIDGVVACLAVAGYDSGVGRALRRAKYGADRRRMKQLAALFAVHVAPMAHGFDAIVPVPSPWTRRLARGFAGASLLADALSRCTGVPVAPVLRLAPGSRQAGLRAGRRAENLAGRLRAVGPVPGRALVVDDVLTTGTTLAAAARELLGDCTERVWAAVLTAVPPPTKQGHS